MTITQWPRHGVGTFEAGTLFEMQGVNLDYLPRDLVIVKDDLHVNSALGRYAWRLDSVSLDGTRAYFRLNAESSYSVATSYQVLTTPINPPRVLWTDYDDESPTRGIENVVDGSEDMR